MIIPGLPRDVFSDVKKNIATNLISSRVHNLFSKHGVIDNLQTSKAEIKVAKIDKINNPELNCLRKIINEMFCIEKCQVVGLTCKFKKLICETVEDCPYYYCDCSGNGDIQGVRGISNFNNFNNLSDNSNSFFHEEIINDDDLSNMGFSITETDNTNINTYSKFISKNLLADENLVSNNLKIISIDTISKGKWLFNGNIAVEIPASTSVSNIKLFVYLDENVVSSGEIDLGSHSQVNSPTIKSYPFNLMFKNDLDGKKLKIGIISFDNKNEIKLLGTTNFFANQM